MESGQGSQFLQLLEQLKQCHEQELSQTATKVRESLEVELAVPEEFALPAADAVPRIPANRELLQEIHLQQESGLSPTGRMSKCVTESSGGSISNYSKGRVTESSGGSSWPDEKVPDELRMQKVNSTESSEFQDGEVPRFRTRGLWLSSSRSSMRLTRQLSPCEASQSKDEELSLPPLPERKVVSGYCKHIIGYPGSPSRLCWDLIGGLLIMYDLFVIPLKFFEPPDNAFSVLMDWFTLIFWTCNIWATVTVGYVEDGITIMSPKRILLNYLKTWFIIDIIVLTPDWVSTVLSYSDADAVKILRTLRLARSIRLLRLVKLKRVFEMVNDSFNSEYSSLVFSICKMMIVLFSVCHVIACLWFGLARVNEDTATGSWASSEGAFQWAWTEQYVISLHWALTQFTPASMHVQPQNTIERVYAVGTVMFALIGFSYVVGSITSSLAQLRSLSEQTSKDFWLLRRFLKQNAVPNALSQRIQRFIEHAYNRQKQIMGIHQVGVLSLLSKQLMEELQCGINLPHMKVHPLFNFLNDYSAHTMNQLAKEAVGRTVLARGDTLFLPQHSATAMYFVFSGRIDYIRIVGGQELQEEVNAGEDWLGEPVLWTESWHYVGGASAQEDCELLMVATQAFEDILRRWKPVAAVVGQYGRNFISWMEQQCVDGNISDVIHGVQVGDLLHSFIPFEDSKDRRRPSLRDVSLF